MAQLAIPALALSLVGAAASTASQVQALKGQARASELEARGLDLAARTEEEAAAFQEGQFRTQAGRARAKGRAIAAASGLDLSSGSPLFQDLENAKQAELEALNIRRTGQISAQGRRFGASLKRFESEFTRRQIPGTILGGLAQGGSSLGTFAFLRTR